MLEITGSVILRCTGTFQDSYNNDCFRQILVIKTCCVQPHVHHNKVYRSESQAIYIYDMHLQASEVSRNTSVRQVSRTNVRTVTYTTIHTEYPTGAARGAQFTEKKPEERKRSTPKW